MRDFRTRTSVHLWRYLQCTQYARCCAFVLMTCALGALRL